MQETKEDLADLQRLLDECYAAAGQHLRSMLTPDLRSSAKQLARALTGIFVINLAVVTAQCTPLVAPVDGLFYRGRLWFGLPPRSHRVRHVRARPAVSATYIEDELPEGCCLIVHGAAREVTHGHPLHAGYSRYALGQYGLPVPDDLDDDTKVRPPPEDFTGYIEPRRIYAAGFA
jgi:hypothetical protein